MGMFICNECHGNCNNNHHLALCDACFARYKRLRDFCAGVPIPNVKGGLLQIIAAARAAMGTIDTHWHNGQSTHVASEKHCHYLIRALMPFKDPFWGKPSHWPESIEECVKLVKAAIAQFAPDEEPYLGGSPDVGPVEDDGDLCKHSESVLGALKMDKPSLKRLRNLMTGEEDGE
jgi:hypothetical protein